MSSSSGQDLPPAVQPLLKVYLLFYPFSQQLVFYLRQQDYPFGRVCSYIRSYVSSTEENLRWTNFREFFSMDGSGARNM